MEKASLPSLFPHPLFCQTKKKGENDGRPSAPPIFPLPEFLLFSYSFDIASDICPFYFQSEHCFTFFFFWENLWALVTFIEKNPFFEIFLDLLTGVLLYHQLARSLYLTFLLALRRIEIEDARKYGIWEIPHLPLLTKYQSQEIRAFLKNSPFLRTDISPLFFGKMRKRATNPIDIDVPILATVASEVRRKKMMCNVYVGRKGWWWLGRLL